MRRRLALRRRGPIELQGLVCSARRAAMSALTSRRRTPAALSTALAGAVALALQTGCLQPVTDLPPPPPPPQVETLFVVPIDVQDMGVWGALFWVQQWSTEHLGLNGKATFLHQTATGELLIDQLGGALLLDGTFIRPPQEWAQTGGGYSGKDNLYRWYDWRGTMYRAVSQPLERSVTFWSFSPTTRVLEKDKTLQADIDAGWLGAATTLWPTSGVDGGGQLCVGALDGATRPFADDGGFVVGNLRLFDSLEDTQPEVLSSPKAGQCWGSHADQNGIAWLVHYAWNRWGVVRKQNGVLTVEPLELSDCTAARQVLSNALQFICQEGMVLNVWRVDPDRTRLVTTLQLPEGTRLGAYLRDEPLLYLRTWQVGFSGPGMIDACSTAGCSELLSVDEWPPAIGIVDSDMLVADYVVDAGVRVRRIPAALWEGR